MILDQIIEKKKVRLEEQKKQSPISQIVKQIELDQYSPLNFFHTLKSGDTLSIIAEIKKASPSKGLIRADFNPLEIAKAYIQAEVSAISILTEEDFFLGCNRFLKDVRGISPIPILRKDFIIDEYQVYEARALKADAILLIMAVLDDFAFQKFYRLAVSLGLQCLVEVHDQAELNRALQFDVSIIGINNRNLHTFEEDIHTTEKLGKDLPKEKCIVSESSIKSHQDMAYLESLGVDAVLIGESFMREKDIVAAVRKMRGE